MGASLLVRGPGAFLMIAFGSDCCHLLPGMSPELEELLKALYERDTSEPAVLMQRRAVANA